MYSEGPCEQKPIKNFGENGAWAYPGIAPIFLVPPIISGTDKATNFKFCTHIFSIDQNNSPLKISGAVARCVVRTRKTFKCTHILGASRGLLCDSYAVLFSKGSAATECRCGGRFYFTVFRSLSTNPKVKELVKSVHICQSYRKNKSGTFLYMHLYSP